MLKILNSKNLYIYSTVNTNYLATRAIMRQELDRVWIEMKANIMPYIEQSRFINLCVLIFGQKEV